MVAMRTLRLAAPTRCSSEVSSGSWNRVHQLGSIFSATGWLSGGGTGVTGLRAASNQWVGDHVLGSVHFGPTVQPARVGMARRAHARDRLRIKGAPLPEICLGAGIMPPCGQAKMPHAIRARQVKDVVTRLTDPFGQR
jgi:hypothetical protein